MPRTDKNRKRAPLETDQSLISDKDLVQRNRFHANWLEVIQGLHYERDHTVSAVILGNMV